MLTEIAQCCTYDLISQEPNGIQPGARPKCAVLLDRAKKVLAHIAQVEQEGPEGAAAVYSARLKKTLKTGSGNPATTRYGKDIYAPSA
jgi:hypothetical protein